MNSNIGDSFVCRAATAASRCAYQQARLHARVPLLHYAAGRRVPPPPTHLPTLPTPTCVLLHRSHNAIPDALVGVVAGGQRCLLTQHGIDQVTLHRQHRWSASITHLAMHQTSCSSLPQQLCTTAARPTQPSDPSIAMLLAQSKPFRAAPVHLHLHLMHLTLAHICSCTAPLHRPCCAPLPALLCAPLPALLRPIACLPAPLHLPCCAPCAPTSLCPAQRLCVGTAL